MTHTKTENEFMNMVFAIIFISIILSSVIAIRELRGMPVYPNGESYYNLRMAKELTQDPLLESDPVQGREYSGSIFHYFLAISIIFFGIDKTVFLVPILLGILSALLFFRTLVNLGFPKSNAGFSAMLLSVSPAFIYLFSTLSGLSLVVFLSMLSISFYFERNYWDFPWKISGKIYFALSIISLCLLAITNIVAFIIMAIFIFALSNLEGRSSKSFLFAFFPPILLVATASIFTDYAIRQLRATGFHPFNIKQVFSIFGAQIGLDVFLLILFLTGIMIVWSYFKNLRIFHLLSIIFVIASFFNPLMMIYSSMIVSVYCVFAIKHIYYNKWELETIKTGTVILLVCALVFSSVSEISVLINTEPNRDAKDIVLELAELSPGVVMTDEAYGYFIEDVANKKVMIDEEMLLHPDYQYILDDYNYMLTLVRIKDAEPMLNKHMIKYILITPEMKDFVWGGKEKELLLLLKNSEKFQLVSQKGDFELWSYMP